MEQCGTVKQCGTVVEQCNSMVETVWNSMVQCGATVVQHETMWWNSVEQYGGTVEQCKIMWWNSRTVWKNRKVVQWSSVVKQCGGTMEQCGRTV